MHHSDQMLVWASGNGPSHLALQKNSEFSLFRSLSAEARDWKVSVEFGHWLGVRSVWLLFICHFLSLVHHLLHPQGDGTAKWRCPWLLTLLLLDSDHISSHRPSENGMLGATHYRLVRMNEMCVPGMPTGVFHQPLPHLALLPVSCKPPPIVYSHHIFFLKNLPSAAYFHFSIYFLN